MKHRKEIITRIDIGHLIEIGIEIVIVIGEKNIVPDTNDRIIKNNPFLLFFIFLDMLG